MTVIITGGLFLKKSLGPIDSPKMTSTESNINDPANNSEPDIKAIKKSKLVEEINLNLEPVKSSYDCNQTQLKKESEEALLFGCLKTNEILSDTQSLIGSYMSV